MEKTHYLCPGCHNAFVYNRLKVDVYEAEKVLVDNMSGMTLNAQNANYGDGEMEGTRTIKMKIPCPFCEDDATLEVKVEISFSFTMNNSWELEEVTEMREATVEAPDAILGFTTDVEAWNNAEYTLIHEAEKQATEEYMQQQENHRAILSTLTGRYSTMGNGSKGKFW